MKLDKTVKNFLKHWKKSANPLSKTLVEDSRMWSLYMKDITDWVKRQYKQYHPFHYITVITFDPDFSDGYMDFWVEFTDNKLNGIISIPLKKLMTLDITYDDFIVDTTYGTGKKLTSKESTKRVSCKIPKTSVFVLI